MSTITFDFRHYYRKGERRESDQIAYQWDLGHVAEIYVPVNATYEIHYCFADFTETDDYAVESTTAAEDGGYKLTAHIPNELFERSGELKVYVIGSDDNHVLTTYEGYITIRGRTKPEDYVDDDPENEATRILTEAREARDAAIEAAEQAEAAASQSAAQASIAEVYDETATYVIGDLRLHDGQLYECTTEITTPEAWTAAHWTATTVGTELNDINDDVSGLKEDLNESVGDLKSALIQNVIQDEVVDGIKLYVKYPQTSTVITVGQKIVFNNTGVRSVLERVYVKKASTIISLDGTKFIAINVDSSDIVINSTSWVTTASLSVGYYYILIENNITDVYSTLNNFYITWDDSIPKYLLKQYIDNGDAVQSNHINAVENESIPNLRDIIKIELTDTTDATENKYYFNDSNTLTLRTGSACYAQNVSIRLFAGKKYKFNNLYIEYCFVCTKGTKSIIGSLNSLASNNEYTPSNDVDLYLTFTTSTMQNATVYQMFDETGVFNPLLLPTPSLYIIVDSNGGGDFTDIISAINYAKNNINVATVPVTIFIKNGVYNVSPTSDYPYYAIDKGSNRLSLCGESRDGTIIRCTCTSALQGIALNIGGYCTIENLTIENLADDSYTSETILEGNHRPYCIHNDSGVSDSSVPYYTVVKNCKLYSECDTPVGAGMHNNQTQRYENCELIYAQNAVIKQQGSLYVHAPVDSTAEANGLEVVDCVIVCENNSHAMSIGNVSGSQQWSDIPQTYIRNVTYTAGSTELHLDGTSAITPYSKLNSNSTLNK